MSATKDCLCFVSYRLGAVGCSVIVIYPVHAHLVSADSMLHTSCQNTCAISS